MFGVGFDLFSTLFPIFFTIIFVFVIGTMIAMLVRGAKEKRKNDASPRLSVPATVVTKRTNVSHRHHNGANDMDYCTTDTTYYVTFQVESGDRMELRMTGRDYGMLFEGADVFCAPHSFLSPLRKKRTAAPGEEKEREAMQNRECDPCRHHVTTHLSG